MIGRLPSSGRARRPRYVPAARRRSGNPYFNKPKYRSGFEFPSLNKIAMMALPVILLFALGYMIWGPFFRVADISIDGASEDTESRIRKIIDEQLSEPHIFPANSIFFLDKECIHERIGNVFFLESLNVNKKLPGRLEISVAERGVSGALLADGRFLGLDDLGFAVRELTELEISFLGPLPPEYGQVLSPELGAEAVFIGDSEVSAEDAGTETGPTRFEPLFPIISFDGDFELQEKIKIGSQPIATPVMSIVLQADSLLEGIIGEPAVRFVSRGTETDSVEVIMESGWKAYFGADQDFSIQADKLSIILKEKVAERRPELDYVDLRYGERIFFKFKAPTN